MFDKSLNFTIMEQAAIFDFLAHVKGTRFASVLFTSDVKTAAKFSHIKVTKEVTANVQVFAGLKDFTDVYISAVKRTAGKISENNAENIENFEKSETWFERADNVYSIVTHKTSGKKYLFAIFNSAQSTFFIDGEPATKEKVSEFLTPSEAKKLFQDNSIIYNKKNDVLHMVQCRTVALENIKEIK